ncbi:hypothetical protein K438DRAFT_1969616 [Mycena galopus ATCC 62051]|nr:hypothetical protein K438DRAFT_1969616 [Mycena galopus ATCC 62051]
MLRVRRSRPRDSNASYVPTHRRASTLAWDNARSATLHGFPHVTTQKTSIYYLRAAAYPSYSSPFLDPNKSENIFRVGSFNSGPSSALLPDSIVWILLWMPRLASVLRSRTHSPVRPRDTRSLENSGRSEIKAPHRSRPLSAIEPRIRCSRLHLSGASVYGDQTMFMPLDVTPRGCDLRTRGKLEPFHVAGPPLLHPLDVDVDLRCTTTPGLPLCAVLLPLHRDAAALPALSSPSALPSTALSTGCIGTRTVIPRVPPRPLSQSHPACLVRASSRPFAVDPTPHSAYMARTRDPGAGCMTLVAPSPLVLSARTSAACTSTTFTLASDLRTGAGKERREPLTLRRSPITTQGPKWRWRMPIVMARDSGARICIRTRGRHAYLRSPARRSLPPPRRLLLDLLTLGAHPVPSRCYTACFVSSTSPDI